MAKAGLTPDLLVTSDTRPQGTAGRAAAQSRWVELYNTNLIVAAAYDADVQPRTRRRATSPASAQLSRRTQADNRSTEQIYNDLKPKPAPVRLSKAAMSATSSCLL